jgi:hypothetical protein
MLARTMQMCLKPHSKKEFRRTMEKEIIPWLRKEEGFQDEITFLVSDGLGAVGISLWGHEEVIGAYDQQIYPKMLKALTNIVQGNPTVQTYEVANSTFHTIHEPEWDLEEQHAECD